MEMKNVSNLDMETLKEVYRKNGYKQKGAALEKVILDDEQKRLNNHYVDEWQIHNSNMVKNFMWVAITKGNQKPDQQRLKESVYDLISMMINKDAGQRKNKNLNWEENLDMTLFSIVLDVVALMTSDEINMEDA